MSTVKSIIQVLNVQIYLEARIIIACYHHRGFSVHYRRTCKSALYRVKN